VGLAAAEIERHGIATVTVSMLPEITATVRTPRALIVPFPLGHPFGRPHDPDLQRQVVLAALGLVSRSDLPVHELHGGS
jgi:hypothetical protein